MPIITAKHHFETLVKHIYVRFIKFGPADKPPIMVGINHEVNILDVSMQQRFMKIRCKGLKQDKFNPCETSVYGCRICSIALKFIICIM